MPDSWRTSLAVCLTPGQVAIRDLSRMAPATCEQRVAKAGSKSLELAIRCDQKNHPTSGNGWRRYSGKVRLDRQTDTSLVGVITASGGYLPKEVQAPVTATWAADQCDAAIKPPVAKPDVLKVAGLPFDFWSPNYPNGFWTAAKRQGAPCSSPVLIKQVDPMYTVAAQASGLEGNVQVEAIIRPDGTVGDTRVVQQIANSKGLNERALAAAKLWQFKPAVCDGKPTDMLVTLELEFRLH